jgi:hypothetical protein
LKASMSWSAVIFAILISYLVWVISWTLAFDAMRRQRELPRKEAR